MFKFLQAKPVDIQCAKIFAIDNSPIPAAVLKLAQSTLALHTNDGWVSCPNPHELAVAEVEERRPRTKALLVTVRGKPAYAVVIDRSHMMEKAKRLDTQFMALIGDSVAVYQDVRVQFVV